MFTKLKSGSGLLHNHIKRRHLSFIVFRDVHSLTKWVKRDAFNARGASPVEIGGRAQVVSAPTRTICAPVPPVHRAFALASDEVIFVMVSHHHPAGIITVGPHLVVEFGLPHHIVASQYSLGSHLALRSIVIPVVHAATISTIVVEGVVTVLTRLMLTVGIVKARRIT